MKKTISIIFWIIIILLVCLWTYEFYRVRNGYEAKFCLSNKINTYIDGVSEECIGLGYKVYEYRRTKLKGTEFVSIFAKERHEDIDDNLDLLREEEEKRLIDEYSKDLDGWEETE